MKVSFVIGRFQPLHDGHEVLIKEAINTSDKTIILIGSVDEYRTHKNPFTYTERKQLITEVFPDVICLPLLDVVPDEDWVLLVNTLIKSNTTPEDEIVYVHCDKDLATGLSNNLLKESFKLLHVDQTKSISATTIRKQFTDYVEPESILEIPQETKRFLKDHQYLIKDLV